MLTLYRAADYTSDADRGWFVPQTDDLDTGRVVPISPGLDIGDLCAAANAPANKRVVLFSYFTKQIIATQRDLHMYLHDLERRMIIYRIEPHLSVFPLFVQMPPADGCTIHIHENVNALHASQFDGLSNVSVHLKTRLKLAPGTFKGMSGSVFFAACTSYGIKDSLVSSHVSHVSLGEGTKYISDMCFSSLGYPELSAEVQFSKPAQHAISSVGLPGSCIVIGIGAFAGTYITHLDLRHTRVKTILRAAFSHCHALRTVSMPDTLEDLEPNTFIFCCALKVIDLSACVLLHVLPYGMCNGCKCLTDVRLPASIVYISAMAFKKCTSVQSIVLPRLVQGVHETAFIHCTSLRTITCNFRVLAPEQAVTPMSEGIMYRMEDVLGRRVGSSFADASHLVLCRVPLHGYRNAPQQWFRLITPTGSSLIKANANEFRSLHQLTQWQTSALQTAHPFPGASHRPYTKESPPPCTAMIIVPHLPGRCITDMQNVPTSFATRRSQMCMLLIQNRLFDMHTTLNTPRMPIELSSLFFWYASAWPYANGAQYFMPMSVHPACTRLWEHYRATASPLLNFLHNQPTDTLNVIYRQMLDQHDNPTKRHVYGNRLLCVRLIYTHCTGKQNLPTNTCIYADIDAERENNAVRTIALSPRWKQRKIYDVSV